MENNQQGEQKKDFFEENVEKMFKKDEKIEEKKKKELCNFGEFFKKTKKAYEDTDEETKRKVLSTVAGVVGVSIGFLLGLAVKLKKK